MAPSDHESDPLLGRPNGHQPGHRNFVQRTLQVFKHGDDEPSWTDSFTYFIFGSWLNIFLLFVPLSFVSHLQDWDAALRFTFSFVAIIPLAKVSYAKTI